MESEPMECCLRRNLINDQVKGIGIQKLSGTSLVPLVEDQVGCESLLRAEYALQVEIFKIVKSGACGRIYLTINGSEIERQMHG